MEIKEERLEEEVRQANISLILDSYNDIFSDFDPRPFSERALSDDFLLECKRAAHDKQEQLELILSMPKNKRRLSDELKIKKRLKEHFKKHFLEEEKERQKIKRAGFGWIAIGFIAVVVAIMIRAFRESTVVNSVVEPLLVIPGWFAIWEGLSKIFIKAKEANPDYTFYKKTANVSITFRSY